MTSINNWVHIEHRAEYHTQFVLFKSNHLLQLFLGMREMIYSITSQSAQCCWDPNVSWRSYGYYQMLKTIFQGRGGELFGCSGDTVMVLQLITTYPRWMLLPWLALSCALAESELKCVKCFAAPRRRLVWCSWQKKAEHDAVWTPVRHSQQHIILSMYRLWLDFNHNFSPH